MGKQQMHKIFHLKCTDTRPTKLVLTIGTPVLDIQTNHR
jgi:hypothetical protein